MRSAPSSHFDGPAGRLAGRRILVTGASRGIGEAVARACAEAGADLALTARSAGEIRSLAVTLSALGGRAIALPADMTDPLEVDALVSAAREELGGLDSAVACQGVNRIVPLRRMTDAEWNEVIATNLTGCFFLARAMAPGMAPPAAMVFVSSVSGLPGYRKFAGFGAYCASKRGLLGLAEVLEVECAGTGGRVYSICPRGVDTRMFRDTFPGAVAELTAKDVADRIVDLLDPSTAPASGAVIEI